VGRILADPSRLAAMARASESMARPDAAEQIAGEVLSVVRGRREKLRVGE
jgi:UDP-N-acetylglucosamine:LPS N-acetylglucosamine transferase